MWRVLYSYNTSLLTLLSKYHIRSTSPEATLQRRRIQRGSKSKATITDWQGLLLGFGGQSSTAIMEMCLLHLHSPPLSNLTTSIIIICSWLKYTRSIQPVTISVSRRRIMHQEKMDKSGGYRNRDYKGFYVYAWVLVCSSIQSRILCFSRIQSSKI